jgi:mannose-6-phosphate isomerase-like protein (cupin superfamily)
VFLAEFAPIDNDRAKNTVCDKVSGPARKVLLEALENPGCSFHRRGTGTMDVKNLNEVPAFITKDGSEIRELLSYRNSCIRNQSLAEARLPPGGSTQGHHHVRTEEIYYILEGFARMQVGDEVRDVGPGDAIAIPPGVYHQITNTGTTTLRFLCCCAPCYEHEDTVIEA